MSNFSIFFEMNSTLPGNFGIGAKMCKFVSYHAGSQNTGKHFWYYQNPPRFVLPYREKGPPEAGEKVPRKPGKRFARPRKRFPKSWGKGFPEAGEKVPQKARKRLPKGRGKGPPEGEEKIPQSAVKRAPAGWGRSSPEGGEKAP